MKPETIDVPIRLTLDGAEVRRLHLEPGDVVVVNVDSVSQFKAVEMRDLLARTFTENKVIVLGGGVTIDVIEGGQPESETT
jgi:hypothetical protein